MNLHKIFAGLLALCLTTAASAQENKTFESEAFAGLSVNGFKGSDAEGLDVKMGFHAGFTARYNFVKSSFLEASLGVATKGYNSDLLLSSGEIWSDDGNYDSEVTTTFTTYNIDLPILIGYRLVVNDNLNLRLKVGPYLTYAFSGKEKSEGYMTEYPDIHSSETEYIDKEVKIGDMDGFNRFGYGIHAGIGMDFKRFIFNASYQRAFSKICDDKKIYEQNFLISIGYKF